MLQFDKLAVDKRQIVQRACSFLFSPEKAANTHFLNNLCKSDVKTAFRMKAKMYHPDLHRQDKSEMLLRRQERFLRIQNSYETLVGIFPKEEKVTTWKHKVKMKKIIAVGGAKGGIGKSVFAANLGVVLSGMGKKTVVADFDLGGANLHLYLGQTRIEKNINDYLNKKVNKIEDVLIQSSHGPIILGGDSSRLGSANIHFAKKIKLIKAIQSIEADYVIIDLGGDTSFNMIDFFNMADVKIVMTTCEPASYLDAYNFIKVALHRKLTRIFSRESDIADQKDGKLEQLIRDSLLLNAEKKFTINDLMKKVASEYPDKKAMLNSCLNQYNPTLLINKSNETSEAAGVAKRVKDVAAKMLSINVNVVAPVLFNKKTEESTKELVPVTVKYIDGYMANRIKEFVKNTVV